MLQGKTKQENEAKTARRNLNKDPQEVRKSRRMCGSRQLRGVRASARLPGRSPRGRSEAQPGGQRGCSPVSEGRAAEGKQPEHVGA